eukprot:8157_1
MASMGDKQYTSPIDMLLSLSDRPKRTHDLLATVHGAPPSRKFQSESSWDGRMPALEPDPATLNLAHSVAAKDPMSAGEMVQRLDVNPVAVGIPTENAIYSPVKPHISISKSVSSGENDRSSKRPEHWSLLVVNSDGEEPACGEDSDLSDIDDPSQLNSSKSDPPNVSNSSIAPAESNPSNVESNPSNGESTPSTIESNPSTIEQNPSNEESCSEDDGSTTESDAEMCESFQPVWGPNVHQTGMGLDNKFCQSGKGCPTLQSLREPLCTECGWTFFVPRKEKIDEALSSKRTDTNCNFKLGDDVVVKIGLNFFPATILRIGKAGKYLIHLFRQSGRYNQWTAAENIHARILTDEYMESGGPKVGSYLIMTTGFDEYFRVLVREVSGQGSRMRYLVHFVGWGESTDEYVGRNTLLAEIVN